MDLVLNDLTVCNFRAIKKLHYVFENHNLILGSCNYGKTAVIEAICLCLGCIEWISEEDTRDFFVDKKMLIGDPVSKTYWMTVTLTGFSENNPKLYPEWFKERGAYPFWWDEGEKKAYTSRQNESQVLACKVAYIATKGSDNKMIRKRYFLGENEEISLDTLNPHVPTDFFKPLAVVYFPLICLEWVEEFQLTKEKVLKEADIWWGKQVGNLDSVNNAVQGMNKFMEKAKAKTVDNPLSSEEEKRLLDEAQMHMQRMHEAIKLVKAASEEPEDKIIIELAKALPWIKMTPDSEKKLLDVLKNPSFEDLLNFLVEKSHSSGAGKAFEPIVQLLLDREKTKQTCLIIFDEVEHFIPDEIMYSFMENLLRLARQSVFISHDTRLINFFGTGEVKEIENKNGEMTIYNSDPFTLPQCLAFPV